MEGKLYSSSAIFSFKFQMEGSGPLAGEFTIEIDEPFDAFNNPAVECSDQYSARSGDDEEVLSDAMEEEFVHRYEELNRALSDPHQPLSESGDLIYGETMTFSERNIVVLDRWVLGPEYRQMIASMILCIAPVVVQAVVFGSELHAALHTFTFLSLALTIATLLWTSIVDPGIVPKRMTTLEPNPGRVRLFVNDKETQGLRYCPTCDIYRGPRTHHCGICGNCVDQFDHHCPWTGTCVGANNYHAFLFFLHALHLLASFIVISSSVVTVSISRKKNIGVVSALEELHFIPVVLICFVLLSGVSVTGLMLFHWYLLARNLTTAEFLKSVYDTDNNPWDLGLAKNVFSKWTGWVDSKTFSANYRCYIVRETVRREIDMLSREREEEIRIHRERKQSERVVVHQAEAPQMIDRPTFIDDGTELYI